MSAVRRASLPMTQLPLIDLRWPEAEVAQRIGQACRAHGFFYVTGHGIDAAAAPGVAGSRSAVNLPRAGPTGRKACAWAPSWVKSMRGCVPACPCTAAT
jgi:hypothetical protein